MDAPAATAAVPYGRSKTTSRAIERPADAQLRFAEGVDAILRERHAFSATDRAEAARRMAREHPELVPQYGWRQ
jgi:hypothetical protein